MPIKRDYDTALIVLKKAIDIDPRDAGYLSRIAYVYRMKKQYNEAINYYKKALEIKKDAFYVFRTCSSLRRDF